MSDDRDQAIKDVAEHSKYSEEQVRLKVNNALYWPLTEYAVAQRERVIQLERENAAKAERVIALERALRGLDILLDFGDIIEPNTAQTFDDPTAINAAFAAARAALNGESK